jgi:isopenicillin N synthase-like dioxygenase
MTFAVPVVDIAPYVTDGTPEARARTAAEMDAACRTVGFVQIVGHGVPARITDGLAAAMDGLFERPLDVKSRYRTPPEFNRGYSPPKSESLSLSLGVESATRMNDFFEAFNVGAAASWFPGLDLPQPDYAENTWPDVPGSRMR